MMLGDLGARVIKVESADRRRHPRRGGRRGPAAGRATTRTRRTSCRPTATRSRSSSTSRTPTTARCWRALVRRADVLLENFRVGVLDRLGFPVARLHELNPRPGDRLSITGFGHDGPEAGRAGYDQIAQGEGGLMSMTGTEQPTKVGVPIADLLAGMNLAYGVRGRAARAARAPAAGASSAPRCWPAWSACTPSRAPAGRVGRRGAGPRRRAPPGDRAVRHVRDRRPSPVQVAVRLARGCGGRSRGASGSTPTDPRFATNRERVAHRDELVARDRGASSPTDPAEHWLDAARRRRASRPARCASMDDVYAWEQMRSQGLRARRRPPGVRPAAAARARRCASTTTLQRRARAAPAAAAARRARRRDPGAGGSRS